LLTEQYELKTIAEGSVPHNSSRPHISHDNSSI